MWRLDKDEFMKERVGNKDAWFYFSVNQNFGPLSPHGRMGFKSK